MSAFRVGSGPVVYVGAGARISGVLRGGARVEVHGKIDGEVACDRLVVGAGGSVSGSVSAREADVSGSVASKIAVAHRLTVRAQGRVEGAWNYVELEVERGGLLRGDAAPGGAAVPPRSPALRERTTGVRRLVLVHGDREPSAAGKDASRVC